MSITRYKLELLFYYVKYHYSNECHVSYMDYKYDV